MRGRVGNMEIIYRDCFGRHTCIKPCRQVSGSLVAHRKHTPAPLQEHKVRLELVETLPSTMLFLLGGVLCVRAAAGAFVSGVYVWAMYIPLGALRRWVHRFIVSHRSDTQYDTISRYDISERSIRYPTQVPNEQQKSVIRDFSIRTKKT